MATQTTEGVRVSVVTRYQPEYSAPGQMHYVFTYRIWIENNTDNTIQLLRRHWLIFDSLGTHTEVEGEGVVGQQPVLEPGQVHEYISSCNLKSALGSMKGKYLMRRLLDEKDFLVDIPEFILAVPSQLN